jgi:hypothetical protein
MVFQMHQAKPPKVIARMMIMLRIHAEPLSIAQPLLVFRNRQPGAKPEKPAGPLRKDGNGVR